MVAQRILASEDRDGRWQLVAACSYAECAGSRAVPDIMHLYVVAMDHDRPTLRLVALCALARSADREGVFFVLDHMDDLWTILNSDLHHPEIVSVGARIADYLILGRDAELLHTGPVYDRTGMAFGIPDYIATQAGGVVAQRHDWKGGAVPGQAHDLKQIELRWRDAAEQIRQEWAERLK